VSDLQEPRRLDRAWLLRTLGPALGLAAAWLLFALGAGAHASRASTTSA
jgi:hypothetical protein